MQVEEGLFASPRRRFYASCLGAVVLAFVTTLYLPQFARFLVPACLLAALAWIVRAHLLRHGAGSGRLVLVSAGTSLALLFAALIGMALAIVQQTGLRD